jgi:hypothetical protein
VAKARKTENKGKANRKRGIDIELAAESAAADTLEDLDPTSEDISEPFTFKDEDNDEGVANLFSSRPEDVTTLADKDVFIDGFKKATAQNDGVRFFIKKNSQFLATRNYPYDWERLQAEYGEGYYVVQAKGVKTGRILCQQTEMIGDSRTLSEQNADNDEAPAAQVNTQPDPMAWITLMNQQQEKAESKAMASATAQTNSMAMMMQAMMTMQSQSTQQFQTMMMEMNKQAQQQAQSQLTLLTTLLTAKSGKSDDGMSPITVMKMVQDAEKSGESRAKEMYRIIEDKVDKLADERAELLAAGSSDGEESMIKTVIKGFVPILTQAMQNGSLPGMPAQAPQRSPAEIEAANHFTPAQVALIEKQRQAEAVSAQRARQAIESQRVANNTVVPGNFAARPAGAEARPVASPVINPQVVNPPPATKVSGEARRGVETMKEKILNFAADDIGAALVSRKGASETAEEIVKKLETSGVTRQTILDNVSLKDVFDFAEAKGIPLNLAKSWLTEFYESIQKTKTADGVPARTRAQSRQPSQNI